MFNAIAPVAALLLGAAILLTGQGLQGVLLPVRANMEGFSTLAVGFVGATYFLGFTLGCWKGTALIRNVGHVRVFAAMTALASAAPLIMGLWVNLWSWGILRTLTGFCFAVLYVVIESWLNEQSSDENRGTVFSAYVLINMTVLAVGQQMMLLSDPAQLQLFAVTSVLVSLAAVPVALSTSQTPRDVEDARLDMRYAFRNCRAGLLGSLANGLANGAFWALAAVFVASVSTNVSVVAWFMTAVVLGGAAGQFPLGLLSDKMDRRYVMLGVALASAIIAALIWTFAHGLSRGILLAMGFAWGMFSFPLYSISVAHANDRVDPDKYVMISSILLLMYGIGAISGPFLATGFMTLLGSTALYAYIALVHIGIAVYLVFGSLRRKAVARDKVGDFEDALASALTASRFYEHEHQLDELESARTGGQGSDKPLR